MRCIKCNFENPDGSVFCSSCGNNMNNINQNINMNVNVQPVLNQNSNIEPPKKKSAVLPIVIVLLLLGLIAGIYFITIGNKNENKKDDDVEENVVDKIEDEIVETTKTYNVGDEVTLVDGSSWYYVSEVNGKVTLFSKSNYGEATYFCTDGQNMYETSNVKDVVENQYLPSIKSSISSAGGDVSTTTARIFSVDDIKQIINSTETEPKNIEINSDYKWLFETGSYWLSTHSYDNLYNSAYLIQSYGSFANITVDIAGLNMGWGNLFNIRPVLETSINNIRK